MNSLDKTSREIHKNDNLESWSRFGMSREELLRHEGIESLFEDLRKAV